MIPILHGLSEIAERYDGFIVDLWGVLHDGVRAFPPAVDCLERLRERGKRVLILSNAPRRAAVVAARNAELGIPIHLCDAVMSSGEAAWQHLAARADPWHRALGRRCHHLGPERDRGMREGLDYDFVDHLAEADFVLATGALSFEDTPETYAAFLDEALGRRLPMVCANPDLEVIRGARREICAGAIALGYEELGGEVRYHGKPHAEIYATCLAMIEVPARARIAAIGDSLRTDIAGANRAGIDGLFITGGLQGVELGADAQGNVEPARLEALCAAAGEVPTAALPALRW
jgi:HAD superfamily hydrolase (TIGR01459 family)